MIWALLLLLLLLVAVVIAAPLVTEACRPKMNDTARRDAPGEFVGLSRGVTHYRWLGQARGPVAVCVHGLTTPSYVWGPIAKGLGRLGFRVLVYDLYGRGYSDRPGGPQDAAFFVTQLEELLEAQGIEDDITLLGYSMGGAIATAFAAHFPNRLRRLVLLAPAGMGHDLGPVTRLVVDRGRFGTWLMMAFYGRSFRQSLAAERGMETSIDGIVDLQAAELGFRGFRGAVLACLRGLLRAELEEEHREIGREGVPVLAIWGKDDEVISIAGLRKLAQWNPAARQEVVEGAEHALAYTHTDEVLHAMRDLMGPCN